jgi:VWFA-related protein
MKRSAVVIGRILTLLPLLSGAHGLAIAQQNEAPAPSTLLEEGVIKLDVAVTDRGGKPATGLSAADFTLLDNGQATNFVSFHAFNETTAKPSPPVEVILVIDSVNLSPQQVATTERDAENFLRENNGRLAQPVMVYRLTNAGLAGSVQPSLDGNQLAAGIASGREPRLIWHEEIRLIEAYLTVDYARMRNAFSLRGLGSIAIEERKRPGRKLLFWIGPGWPVEAGGEYTFDEIVELSTRLREARITLSSVTAWAYPEREFSYENFLRGAKNAKDGSPFDLTLEVLAIQSGGQVMEPASDLKGLIEKSVADASDFYTLTFDPPRTNTMDEYHDLKVEVDRPDVTVRTNTGYYDQPAIYDQPPPRKAVALAELQQVLMNALGRNDEDLARQLNGLVLTERMSSGALTRWRSQMPGARSRSALLVLADESAFQKPAADAILKDAAPDIATQKQMMARTVEYVANTIPKLPDFFATRTTVRYEEPKQKDEETWKTVVGDQILRQSETTKVTMHIRNGKEVAEAESKRAKGVHGRERDLVTEGTFGPILSTVLMGAAAKHSQMSWSRWEQGPEGREAVFVFAVPQETPLFAVGFCCLADPDGTIPFKKMSAFRGEMAIDPKTGAILRIEVLADLDVRLPLNRSGVVVEYGPVTIGGKEYICPTRSISISRSRTVHLLHEWNERFGVYGPFETMLNDDTFGDYHVFRSTSRILTGMEAAP